MTVQPVPKGYSTVTPWIITPDTAQLIDYVKKAFDAKEHRPSCASTSTTPTLLTDKPLPPAAGASCRDALRPEHTRDRAPIRASQVDPVILASRLKNACLRSVLIRQLTGTSW